jgi:DNA-binding NarL/FixJ family response regulator
MAAPSPQLPDAWLELPDGRLHRVGKECTIGRLGDCDLVLSGEGVSRRHARLAPVGKAGAHALSDLGSTNGTFVNGLKLSQALQLGDRDMIGIGNLNLKYRTGQAVSEMSTLVSAVAPAAPPKRILVAADTSLVGDGLLRLIERQAGWMVAGHAAEARQIMQLRAQCRPEAILLDASTDGVGALSLLGDLIAADPGARIAVLLSRPDPDFIARILRRGVLACVLKSDSLEELVRALESVLAGSVYLSRRIAAVTVRQLAGTKEGGRRDGPQGLTDRELEIFHLIGGAKANREIAAALGMSVKTVETHKENIKIKLGVATAAELAGRAREWLG